MKKLLLLITVSCFITSFSFSQTPNYWQPTAPTDGAKQNTDARILPGKGKTFSLRLSEFKTSLKNAPVRGRNTGASDLLVTFPTAEGNFESFRIVEASVMHPDLEAKYPGIKSYAGQGIDDPTATVRFSISEQQGLHAMVFSSRKSTFYIDPHSADKENYSVYSRNDMLGAEKDFECLTEENIDLSSLKKKSNSTQRTNDKKLRKYRLALSCNAEYGNLFAGSGTTAQKKANILAQMNVTMTRVNGVYERDLAITMELVPNNDAIIYFGSTSSDPWGNEFNNKTQQVIDTNIGNANYDIGHNFNTSGGGNAGCIGCVCQTGSKGSGYTGRPNPTGDAFDIDYVAHEMGHQFGGYHTMNTCSRSGDGTTEVEPASGSSIMGYAGICDTNVQSSSDDYFHYVTIRDISANVQSGVSAGCAQIINIANNPPSANAGPDYTIPKSTPFVLKGQSSDPDGDALTYTWEQNDPERAVGNGAPQSTWTQGPMFRSRKGTTNPNRFMPQISDVIAGNLTPTWEVIPSVGRSMEFALTVRDNKAGGGQTSDDLMTVTVSGSAGPFIVNVANTSETWTVGQTKMITWNVAGTNAAPVNCSHVNILLSTDGGYTYPVTLTANTPNDGTHAIAVPNNISNACRIKIEAVNNIFYDISNANFTISGAAACSATVPTGLAATNLGTTQATLNWNTVVGANYDVRYKTVSASTWTTQAASTNSLSLSGLSANTSYQVQVRSKCGSTTSAYSTTVTFTTSGSSTATYCASNGANTSDEYIGRVQIGTIDKSSGASSGGYGNFTALSTDLTVNTINSITITPTWTSTIYNEGYGVWIDYNQDGDFSDAGEQVWTRSATNASPVIGTFTVPTGAKSGATRMRVSLQYNATPGSCGTFNYGEVEDYTVNIINASSSGCSDVTLSLTLDNYPEETSWTIKNQSGTTVASGGTYNGSPGATISEIKCLPAGCYSFTIIDSYGDGMCCTYGNGSYSLKGASGNTIASGGSFGLTETTSFCVGSGAKDGKGLEIDRITVETPENVVSSLIYPNPVQSFLNVAVRGDSRKSIKVMSASGAEIRSLRIEDNGIDVSHLPTGVYFISIETSKEVIMKKFIKE